MRDLFYIVVGMGITMLVFSILTYLQIRRQIQINRRFQREPATIADAKYLELKTRQDYIMSIGSILLAMIAFIGYGSVKDFKDQLSAEFAIETNLAKQKTEDLTRKLDSLSSRGDDVGVAYTATEADFRKLQSEIKRISTKEIVSQNIYIVESIPLKDHPLDKKMNGTFTVRFDKLKTVSGKQLPKFSKPPSIMCLSTNGALPQIQKVTSEAIFINVSFSASSAGGDDQWGSASIITLWIMEQS